MFFFFEGHKAYTGIFGKAIIVRKHFKVLLDISYLEIYSIAASISVPLQLDGFGQHRTYLGKKSERLL